MNVAIDDDEFIKRWSNEDVTESELTYCLVQIYIVNESKELI